MKKLIARDMSKEVEDREISTNVVARLMGLETAAPRSRSRSSSRCSLDTNEAGEFGDDYEIGEKANLSREVNCDKQMDLLRRKFIEAKQLVTNEKLHQSKEFQEALQFLSSNKDLFAKFLQESNSLFSHPEATRITVLRPSNSVVDPQKCVAQECRSKQIKKSEETGWIDPAKPSRIVVLKPSPGKALDTKAIASSSPSSYFDEAEDAETRELAKEITRQIRETFRGHHRNETLSSSSSSCSVLSNGYVGGDDGSLNRSNIGNLSNSEIMSPSSRHSWDCPNRFESPFSSSSFSQVSFSPESSSVYREAKKRLYERWAMMSLNGDTHQQRRNSPKASTALGDMLALSEIPIRSSDESNKVKQETRRSISCMGSGLDQEESASGSMNALERSKSVPEIRRLNGGTSLSGTSKAQAFTEAGSLKPSWKVSSLFFFGNKKPNKEKKTDAPSRLVMPSESLRQQRVSPGEVEVTTPNENKDQPSPVSVLQPPFEEECVGNPECFESRKRWTTQGEETSLRCNLIGKSPPIGSIARFVSWEEDESSSYTNITKPTTMRIKEDEEWYEFVKKLLIASGFSGSDPLMTRWHSPDSPMDPSLRDKFANKELIKRRKQRSNRKLVFDCINAIITETTITSTLAGTGFTEMFDMVEHVWTELKDWWLVQDSNSLDGGESLVWDEVVGKTWNYSLQVEVNNLGTEIEAILLQELVEEAVFDLTR